MTRQGFSLVELSIVLVILGLLTGGILTGQNLIRAAELRSVATQMQNYQAAMYTFRDKYFAMPGDMATATQFWGAADAGDGAGADCFTLESTTTATCNGSGNGYVNTPTGGVGAWIYGERFHIWKHLANAGLIEGSYTGRTDHATDPSTYTMGKNVPAAKIGGGYWDSSGDPANGGAMAFISSGNMFALRSLANEYQAPMYAEELWNLDMKLDDGPPG